ncbi:surfactant protein Ba isoform X2 [Cottoperca gobio]|uniref:Surfactant protein Ba isoform X2 n=1 Tax=Cottoperca gobio TaxID=56716 RepID=A0A6J2QR72_COTGO|nr:prosaposin-like isoform X2 [Cottoperca gobio]
MALFKIAFLLFICLEGCASKVDGLGNVPDALRATGDVCQDCTQIFGLLVDLFSNADLQKKMMDGIESLCDLLPGPASTAKLCKDEVEKMFPVIISFIAGGVKPAELCKIIGLCAARDNQEKMLSYFVKEALQVQPKATCSFCLFLIKTLEDLLPKERTEDAVIKLLKEICHILPASYRDQCQATIGKFSKTVLEAIVGYATPQHVCVLLQMCNGQEAPLVDPCTLTTYRCRDMKTALKCETVFYCQKFAWKPYYAL